MTKYEQISKAFTDHPSKGDQPERYQLIRREAKILAKTLVEKCPESRELSLALTKLEESLMWANAAIARNE